LPPHTSERPASIIFSRRDLLDLRHAVAFEAGNNSRLGLQDAGEKPGSIMWPLF
jgi:hypothetical protein